MSEIIKNQLLLKASSDELHNVYLLDSVMTDEEHNLHAWAEGFLSDYLQSRNIRTSVPNHQDILFLEPDPKKKYYGIESLDIIFKFLNYRAVEIPRKFLVLTDVGKLSVSDSNKLLKTFEEPPIPLTIFLLNPNLNDIIPTVASRCINLTLNFEKIPKDITTIPWPQSFSEFSAKISSEELSYRDVTNFIMEEIKTADSRSASLYSIQRELQILDRDILYNGPVQGRAYRLYRCLELLLNS